jgi:hypothetical protein
MLARLARPGLSPLVRRAALPLRPALMPRRLSSSALRNDGFNEALPRGDVVAPIIFGSFFAGAWYMADEGRIKPMIEEIEPNTDPNAWPTPKQMFGHIWPFIASTLGMIFESVACKFTQTSDMKWLCTTAMNDDMKAAVALCLLVAPAEHSSAFVHAINEHGTLRRIKEVVQIYKTLPRDQHDDVMTNACVITAKVAAMPALRDDSLGADDFVWMMPEDKAYLYTACGIEGLAHTWQDNPKVMLRAGGATRLAELVAGVPLNYKKKENSVANQELARRLLGRLAAKRSELLEQAHALEAQLLREQKQSGDARGGRKKTIWQATGVHRGETEAELGRRRRQQELANCRADLATLQSLGGLSTRSVLEQYGPAFNMLSGAALGFVYGAARGYFRGYWQDVTPSVIKELSVHVGKRTALGTALLVGTFEAAPHLKRMALEALGREDVRSYKQEGALEQLWYVDAAYLGVVALANYLFPYILLPTALNPMQLMIPPNDVEIPMPKGAEAK